MPVFYNLLTHSVLIKIFPIRKFVRNTFRKIVNFYTENIVDNSK